VVYHEAAFDEVVVADRRAELCERHGKVRVLHLTSQRLLELLPEPAGSVDVPFVTAPEERREEREPLDVVPVRVGDHQMAADGGAARHQRLPEAVAPGAAVEHEGCTRAGAPLHT